MCTKRKRKKKNNHQFLSHPSCSSNGLVDGNNNPDYENEKKREREIIPNKCCYPSSTSNRCKEL